MNETEKRVLSDTENEDTVIDLSTLFRNLLNGVIKFWWLAVVLSFLFACATYYLGVRSYAPMYRSQATFTVTTSAEDESGDYNFYYDSATAEQLGLTFPHILSSELFTDAMKEQLGTKTINGSVSAQAVSESNMVTMSVVSSDPEDAKKILEAAIEVYPEVSRFVIGETKFNIIDPPKLPTEPYNTPNFQKDYIEGAIIGFALGAAIIGLYALLRRTVHKTSDLEKEMNFQCLTSLPVVKVKRRAAGDTKIQTAFSSHSNPVFSENMELLRLRVEKQMEENNKKVLLVASTIPGEGKSLVSVCLAMRFAKNGKRVLLIDGDFRKQTMAANIGIQTDVKVDTLDLVNGDIGDLLIADKEDKIFFFGGSKPLKDTSRFLSGSFADFISRVRPLFDYIVIDTPPSGEFEDTLVMKEYADAILFVVKQDYARKSKVVETVSNLEAEGTGIIGYVFNGVTGTVGNYGGYVRYGRYSRYGKYGKYSKYNKYGYRNTDEEHGYGYGYDYESDTDDETERAEQS